VEHARPDLTKDGQRNGQQRERRSTTIPQQMTNGRQEALWMSRAGFSSARGGTGGTGTCMDGTYKLLARLEGNRQDRLILSGEEGLPLCDACKRYHISLVCSTVQYYLIHLHLVMLEPIHSIMIYLSPSPCQSYICSFALLVACFKVLSNPILLSLTVAMDES
jgi:hypothetical protein